MAKKQFVACTVECIPVTVQYTCYLKCVVKEKFECEWKVNLKSVK